MLTGMQEANAFSSYARKITSYCSSQGYDLLPVYEQDTCDAACHQNAQGQAAYDAQNYEYFCPAPTQTPTCTDADGDGFFAEGGDCGTAADFDDNNSAAYPGAAENCTDGIDNDGNGLVDSADPNAVGCDATCTDMDMDGYSIEGGACGAIDCNDNDASINPGAAEICSDAIDNNCNGMTDTADVNAIDCPLDCTDNDGDGYSIEGGSCGAIDCDDNNAEINPGALEICDDATDNNCNGLVDGADGVCQNDDGNDGEDDLPWWRDHCKHGRGGHHHSGDAGDDGNDAGDDDNEDAGDDAEDMPTNGGSRRGHHHGGFSRNHHRD